MQVSRKLFYLQFSGFFDRTDEGSHQVALDEEILKCMLQQILGLLLYFGLVDLLVPLVTVLNGVLFNLLGDGIKVRFFQRSFPLDHPFEFFIIA